MQLQKIKSLTKIPIETINSDYDHALWIQTALTIREPALINIQGLNEKLLLFISTTIKIYYVALC